MSSNVASTSSNRGATSSARKDSNRPEGSAFTQQELPACKPVLTPGWIIAIYMLVAVIFIPIGVIALLASNTVVEIVDEYETVCIPDSYTDNGQRTQFIQDVTTNKSCYRALTVPEYMEGPIYVYYELDNYYQNHRRYVKSVSVNQLLYGNTTSSSYTDDCSPEQYLGGLSIIPCGLEAWTLFNDTYNFTLNGQKLAVNKTGISWKSDREGKYGSIYPENFPNNLPRDENGSLIGGAGLDLSKTLQEDEDLIVWMRTAALPTFRKLYGRIEQNLDANTQISVGISNNYNTYSFGGKKRLVLSTTNWLGGKNDFLGIAYITIGSICVFLALVFLLAHLKAPRPLGDTDYLSWNKSRLSVKVQDVSQS